MNLIDAVARLKPKLALADLAIKRTIIIAYFSAGDVEALREVLGECEKLLCPYSDAELDHRNAGASVMAAKLDLIAKTGCHSGTFGDPAIDATAVRIAELHRQHAAALFLLGQERLVWTELYRETAELRARVAEINTKATTVPQLCDPAKNVLGTPDKQPHARPCEVTS